MNANSPEAPATAEARPARSRTRLLVPLAGLLVAAVVTVGSGADFVSNSVNAANAFSSGTLQQTNSKAGSAIFNLSNLKPGDTLNGKVTITNSGTLASDFTLTEDAANGFATKSNLSLVITRTGTATPVWSGTFGELTAAGPLSLGTFAAGEASADLHDHHVGGLVAGDHRIVVTRAEASLGSAASPISQILDVLIENALKHGRGDVRLSGVRQKEYVTVQVADDGPRPRGNSVFQRRPEQRSATSGEGIGLAISAELAEIARRASAARG
ncbi:TasA family protein [Microbacterium sp.]|uniref:TasA family protein n=1 Tax=Microbacterium sp. TaxID=51671 RepID=UPI002810F29A|nr:TasA family protein [Microbacterium sp.]